jgi:hypothetical protein
MNDHSFDFLQFCINNGHLKRLTAPEPGCMVIFFDRDNKIIDSDIVTEAKPFAFEYEKDSTTMGFYQSVKAEEIKEQLLRFLKDPKETEPLIVSS